MASSSYPISPLPSSSPDIFTLISPTKARLAALNATSWSQVTTSLTRLFAPAPVPRFERNDATLASLTALLSANEAADLERRILHEARVEELGRFKADEEGEARAPDSDSASVSVLLRRVEESLPRESRDVLNDLAKSAVLLAPSKPDAVSMGTRIMQVTADTLDAENEIQRIQTVQKSLETKIQEVKNSIANLQSSQDDAAVEKMQRQTATWNRETKVVGMKMTEYRERVGGLESQCQRIGDIRIEDVREREGVVEGKEKELRGLKSRILSLQGLPPDLEAARGEYERARGELQQLTGRRDRFFEEMVE